jgi:ParB family chromosome partitioning protein
MARNLNRSLADAAKKSIHERREKGESEAPKTHGVLGNRIQAASELARGERVKRVQYMVEPASCRLWAQHNRRYDLLNETRCADLIEGFKSMGKQEFPAIVRRVEGQGEVDYEVICGARRHWTANYLGWKLLVEVRELDDEQAFRLADIENRDREDISDYERALDYKKALTLYYTNQKQMAERLEVTVDWLSRFLALADLPDEIVGAYRDVTEICVAHGRALAAGLKDPKTRRRILATAQALHGQGLDGKAVIGRLKKAASQTTQTTRKPPLASYQTTTGKPMLTIDRKGRDGLSIIVEPGSGASKAELKDALQQAIEAHYS